MKYKPGDLLMNGNFVDNNLYVLYYTHTLYAVASLYATPPQVFVYDAEYLDLYYTLRTDILRDEYEI